MRITLDIYVLGWMQHDGDIIDMVQSSHIF